MPLANLVVGIAMLLFGRRLFWVFVAGTGFSVGAYLAIELLHHKSDPVVFGVACVVGVAGALLAIMAQRLAVGVAGFLAGACLGHAFWVAVPIEVVHWIPVLAGGVLGALVVAVLFDWALIALSSLLGAAVIAQSAPLVPPWPSVLFAFLGIVGLAFQARSQSRRRTRPEGDARR